LAPLSFPRDWTDLRDPNPYDVAGIAQPPVSFEALDCVADLVGALIDPAAIRGSLVERYKRCGKAGCKCMAGKGHGPKYYLTLCLGKGELDAIYVPQQDVNKVKGCVGNYHRVQEALKELCDINRELLRRREPF